MFRTFYFSLACAALASSLITFTGQAMPFSSSDSQLTAPDLMVVAVAVGHDRTLHYARVVSGLPLKADMYSAAASDFRDRSEGMQFRFAVVGPLSEKAKQNQNRIFVLVPGVLWHIFDKSNVRGGNRSIDPQKQICRAPLTLATGSSRVETQCWRER
jgi:hypothetical protein